MQISWFFARIYIRKNQQSMGVICGSCASREVCSIARKSVLEFFCRFVAIIIFSLLDVDLLRCDFVYNCFERTKCKKDFIPRTMDVYWCWNDELVRWDRITVLWYTICCYFSLKKLNKIIMGGISQILAWKLLLRFKAYAKMALLEFFNRIQLLGSWDIFEQFQ
eukprot:TRINITY_DN27519_c0_g1_i2.p2 TRINITY_DN27519_c0_g1~~TRINITY_DN27519_c0_g1_i2.p2  ORF type:complete len:164 (+),score=6.66 TRINITY_DN27519_c0_g1_i2:323-814(+)